MTPDPETSRVETLMAALVYLMTHYQRSGCPKLALCVSRHMGVLALHPEAPQVVRDVCAGLRESWEHAACPGGDGAVTRH